MDWAAEHRAWAGCVYLSQRAPRHRPRSRCHGFRASLRKPICGLRARAGRYVKLAAHPALVAGAIAIVAVVIVTTLLAQRFVSPIRHLSDQTARIAQGDFTPVDLGNVDDELRDLTVSINRMTGRLGQYEREVRRSEQLRTLAQLGAGMAHQLRNAATGSRMAIELHQRQCAAGAAEALDVALRQLRLMESYLQRFLTLSRPRLASREPAPSGRFDGRRLHARPHGLRTRRH